MMIVKYNEGDLMVFVYPVIPGRALKIPVKSREEGQIAIDAMASLLLFLQDDLKVMDDHSNVMGILRWEPDGEGGFDWYELEEEDA